MPAKIELTGSGSYGNYCSLSKQFKVKNVGDRGTSVSISLSGGNSSSSFESSIPSTYLNAGNDETFYVEFKPETYGSKDTYLKASCSNNSEQIKLTGNFENDNYEPNSWGTYTSLGTINEGNSVYKNNIHLDKNDVDRFFFSESNWKTSNYHVTFQSNGTNELSFTIANVNGTFQIRPGSSMGSGTIKYTIYNFEHQKEVSSGTFNETITFDSSVWD